VTLKQDCIFFKISTHLRDKHEVKEKIIVIYSSNKQVFKSEQAETRLLSKISLKIQPLLTRLTSYSHHCFDTTSITPGLEKVTECIPYVRQDQVSHIQ
jgi:hypothetical protein